MKLNKQVPNLELCKKLKELGYPQEGLFWYRVDHRVDNDSIVYVSKRKPNYEAMWTANLIVAPTVAEMGEWLPQIIEIGQVKYQMFITVALDKQFFVVYANEHNYEDNAPFPIKMCHNEADARAKMLIYLFENKLISLEGKDE